MTAKRATGEAKLVAIKLDRVRHLRADFNALALAEDETGLNMLDKGAWNKINAKQFRAVLWALLVHEDADLKLETVGTWLHGGNMGEIAAALASAIKEGAAAANPKAGG